MNYLCQYKDMFGEPDTGVHSYRLFNIAIVDLLLTIVAAYLLSRYFNKGFIYVLVLLLALGVLAHWLFCVDTAFNTFIGLGKDD